MSSELKLSLNNEEKRKGPGWKGLYALLALTLVIASATLAAIVMIHTGGGLPGDADAGKRLEMLALKLEKRGLGIEAAQIWEEYLRAVRPGGKDSGGIWYRIGTIYQENGEYAKSVAAYYRAESFGVLESIENELSGRITESLEMLGRFSALEEELEERTSLTGDEQKGRVVAEIGKRKITDSEVRGLIEDEIDNAIDGAAPGLAGEDRNRQKEMMIEAALKPENRNQWLSSYIAEELIYREAIRKELHRDPDFRRLSRKRDRELLVQRYLNLLYAKEIDITEDMLKDYFENHREEFTDGEGKQRSLEESIQQVYARIRMREESRVQQSLMNELQQKYDAVIHNPGTLETEDSTGNNRP